MDKFKNIYRIQSIRLKNWNYSWVGYYFITICTKNSEHYFGVVENDTMIVNEIGEIAKKYLTEIPNHFKNVQIIEFIIMPNHIHCIIKIDKAEKYNANAEKNDVIMNKGNNRYQNQGKNTISSIIGSYKSICTKTINKIQNEIFFAWQPRFYDMIIKNKKELENVINYIKNNPKNFNNDLNGIVETRHCLVSLIIALSHIEII